MYRTFSRPKKDGEQPSRVFIMSDGEERVPRIPTKYYDVLSDSVAGVMCAVSVIIVQINDIYVGKGDEVSYSGSLVTKWRKYEDIFVFVLWAYLLTESFLRYILSRNLRNYFKTVRNKADTVILIAVTIMIIIALSTKSIFTAKDVEADIPRHVNHVNSTSHKHIRKALEFLCLLRLMLFPRNIACFAKPVNGVSWATAGSTIGKLVFTFLEVMLSISFTYAQIGCMYMLS